MTAMARLAAISSHCLQFCEVRFLRFSDTRAERSIALDRHRLLDGGLRGNGPKASHPQQTHCCASYECRVWAGIYRSLTGIVEAAAMIWSYCIAADIATPSPPEGMVRASSEAEAFALVGHQDTNLYPLCDDVEWPDQEADEPSVWCPPR